MTLESRKAVLNEILKIMSTRNQVVQQKLATHLRFNKNPSITGAASATSRTTSSHRPESLQGGNSLKSILVRSIMQDFSWMGSLSTNCKTPSVPLYAKMLVLSTPSTLSFKCSDFPQSRFSGGVVEFDEWVRFTAVEVLEFFDKGWL